MAAEGGDAERRRFTLLDRLDPPLEVAAARELGVALGEAVLAHGRPLGGIDPAAVRLEKGALVLPEGGPASGPYAAPERGGARRLDARADVYAIGAVLFRAVMGAPPFERPPEELPAELRAIVMRCLHREPERRYQDVRELVAALRGERAAAAPGPADAVLERARGGRSGVIVALVVIAAALVGGAAWWWWWGRAGTGSGTGTGTGTGSGTGAEPAVGVVAHDAEVAVAEVDAAPAAAGPGVVIAAVDLLGGAAEDAGALRAALAERLRQRGVDVLAGDGLRPLLVAAPEVVELTLEVDQTKPGTPAGLTVRVRAAGNRVGDAVEVVAADLEAGVDRVAELVVGATRLGGETAPAPRAGVTLAAWRELEAARALADRGDDPAAEAALAALARRADAPLLAWAELALVRRRLGLVALADEALRGLDKRLGRAGGWLGARLGPARAGWDDLAADAAAATWPLDLDIARDHVRVLAAAGRLDDAARELARARALDDAQRWPDLEEVDLAMARGDGAAARAAMQRQLAHPRATTQLAAAELALELGDLASARAALTAAATAPGADAGTAARAAALDAWLDHLQKRACTHPVAAVVRADLLHDVGLAHGRRVAELTVALAMACGDRFEVRAALARHRAQAGRDRLLGELDALLALEVGDLAAARRGAGAKAGDGAAVTGAPRTDRARRQALLLRLALAGPGHDAAAALRALGPPRAGDRTSFPHPPLLLAVADALAAGGSPDADLAYQEVIDAARPGSAPALLARIGLLSARARTDRAGAQAGLRALVRELEEAHAEDEFPALRAARRSLRALVDQR